MEGVVLESTVIVFPSLSVIERPFLERSVARMSTGGSGLRRQKAVNSYVSGGKTQCNVGGFMGELLIFLFNF